jgi:hypothetical protein
MIIPTPLVIIGAILGFFGLLAIIAAVWITVVLIRRGNPFG